MTQKTAWFMLQRRRLAMQDDLTGGKLGGEVEDETFIGGKARNMHKNDTRRNNLKGGGASGKRPAPFEDSLRRFIVRRPALLLRDQWSDT